MVYRGIDVSQNLIVLKITSPVPWNMEPISNQKISQVMNWQITRFKLCSTLGTGTSVWFITWFILWSEISYMWRGWHWTYCLTYNICTIFGSNIWPRHHSRMCFKPLGIYTMSFQSFVTLCDLLQCFYSIFNLCSLISDFTTLMDYLMEFESHHPRHMTIHLYMSWFIQIISLVFILVL